MHRSVHELIDRKIGRLIGIAGSEFLIQLNAKARFVARMQTPFGESVRVWEGLVGQLDMWHVFLNTEVVNRKAQVKVGSHADW